MRWLGRVALLLVVLAALAAGVLAWIDHDRPDLDDLGLSTAGAASGPLRPGQAVRVTWLGVTTLLFDDGETRFLVDGFFSRPSLIDIALERPVAPDLPGIERALSRVGVTSLAAVIPVHSHYDHAMDSGEVAKRTGATLIGSPSSANAARGAGLPEAQIEVVPDGASVALGRFTVTFVRSAHAPIAGGGPPFPGTIDAPLVPPAPVSAWREDRSYSLAIAHPAGTAIVQGSAGFVAGELAGVDADVVFLGVGGLARLGPEHTARYGSEIVGATGARRVFPIHWDDFTRPYGEIVPFPEVFGGLADTVAELRSLGPGVSFEWLPFERGVDVLPPAP